MSELFNLRGRIELIRVGGALPPIRVIGGKRFGYEAEPIPIGLEEVALNVSLVKIKKDTGVDMVLWGPEDWIHKFRTTVQTSLEGELGRIGGENRPAGMPFRVMVLNPGVETRSGVHWPVWVDHRITEGPGVALGITPGREIFPTTEQLIRAGILGAAMASSDAREYLESQRKYKEGRI